MQSGEPGHEHISDQDYVTNRQLIFFAISFAVLILLVIAALVETERSSAIPRFEQATPAVAQTPAPSGSGSSNGGAAPEDGSTATAIPNQPSNSSGSTPAAVPTTQSSLTPPAAPTAPQIPTQPAQSTPPAQSTQSAEPTPPAQATPDQ
ncbi:MAG: hypothetical protein IMW89_13640 [Ktedonobacteraceae bacterium]|nr:hypothetical protein [Ktedonobacteraceae bacterium]